MRKNENILRVFYGRVREYFTLRGARRVFFFALIALVITAVIVNIVNTDFTMKLFLAACTVCVMATLADSLKVKSDFTAEIKHLEYNHFRRLAEIHGERAAMDTGPAFSQEELFYIKKKKREINYTIVVKSMFLLFLVVFLFGAV